MKNVKKLLIFIIVSTCAFASMQRVNALGGNVGYWADDDWSYSAFPHTINDSNLAQVSGLGSVENHKAIVRWGEGTKWGFTWDQGADNDMINIQYGGGSYGATFGLSSSSDDDGVNDPTSSLGLSASYGSAMDFGDLGVGFSMGSSDDGNDGTDDDPSSMGLWLNVRRAQSLWLFDNMLVNFGYSSDNDPDGNGQGVEDAATNMNLNINMYTHLAIANNTTALVAMGFGYVSAGQGDASATQIALPTWTFAVESAMTDWATCRLGLTAGYVLSATQDDGVNDPSSARGGMDTDFSVGLGFNYGSFNLDLDVTEDIFVNPVQHVVGFEPLNGTNAGQAAATATLTYVW